MSIIQLLKNEDHNTGVIMDHTTGNSQPSNIQVNTTMNWLPILIIAIVIIMIIVIIALVIYLSIKKKNSLEKSNTNSQVDKVEITDEVKTIGNQTITIHTEKKITPTKQEKDTTAEISSGNTAAIVILVFLIVGLLVFGGFALFFRLPASRNDIELKYEPNLTRLGVDCVVYANEDIKDLELEFVFYNSNRREVHRLNKYVGQLKKHEEKEITITLYETLQGSDLPSYCSIDIASGSVGFLTLFS